MLKLKVKKLTETAIIPTYARPNDACMDITSNTNHLLKAHTFFSVPTGISVEIPKKYELQIRGRSGLAAKYGIGLLNGIGTIDYEYRGEIGIILVNHSDADFQIERGMRIAQICLKKVYEFQTVEIFKLSETNRADGGFGSSGLK